MTQSPLSPVRRLALLAAVGEEARATFERLGLQAVGPDYVGAVGGAQVIATVAGMGAARAQAALERLTADGVERVVNLGFAGGLDPALPAGRVLEFAWVIDGTGAAYHLTGGVPEPAAAPSGLARDIGPVLLTLDQIADSVEKKHALFAQHRAGAVDMESLYVARFCHERRLPLTVLRAISDPADVALPAVAAQWVRPDGTVDINAATAYVMMRPWLVPQMMAMQRHARAAAAGLAEAVSRWIG